MHKSGTNYTRILLGNYLVNLEEYQKNGIESYEEVSYDQIHNTWFPNVRRYIVAGEKDYQPTKFLIQNLKGDTYQDFMYDHGSIIDAVSYISAGKRIFLYRNPFDLLISRYFFFNKNRAGASKEVSHPRELIKDFIPDFSVIYNSMKKWTLNSNKTLLISYEELKLFPHLTLMNVLKFLELPVYPELADMAVEASSMDKIRQQEKKRGFAIHSKKGQLAGSFARSGKIGQWQDYFNQEDFDLIAAELKRNNISYKEFWLGEDEILPSLQVSTMPQANQDVA